MQPFPHTGGTFVYSPLLPDEARWFSYRASWSAKGGSASLSAPAVPPACPPAHPPARPPTRPSAPTHLCADAAKASTEVPHRGALLRFCSRDSDALEAAYRSRQDEVESAWWEEEAALQKGRPASASSSGGGKSPGKGGGGAEAAAAAATAAAMDEDAASAAALPAADDWSSFMGGGPSLGEGVGMWSVVVAVGGGHSLPRRVEWTRALSHPGLPVLLLLQVKTSASPCAAARGRLTFAAACCAPATGPPASTACCVAPGLPRRAVLSGCPSR